MTGTTNLNLTKPTVGGDADAWGGELNTDLDTLDSHLQGTIYGLTLSAAGSTATFGVAAGAASGMVLGSAYTKTASSWAVGTGNGSLDTGAIANSTWYHVWEIQRPDTGVTDILISLSTTSPTLPSNYTRQRRLGSMKTDGSAQWVKFKQYGDRFLWDVPVGDVVGSTSGGTTAGTMTLTVPTGVQVDALFNWRVQSSSGNTANNLVSSFDIADTAPSTSVFTSLVPSGSAADSMALQIRTNTSAQVRWRFNNSDSTFWASTQGWVDRRGQ